GEQLTGLHHPVHDDAVGRRADVALARHHFRLPELRLRAVDFRSRLRGLPAAEAFTRQRQLLFAHVDCGDRAIELRLRVVVVALAADLARQQELLPLQLASREVDRGLLVGDFGFGAGDFGLAAADREILQPRARRLDAVAIAFDRQRGVAEVEADE